MGSHSTPGEQYSSPEEIRMLMQSPLLPSETREELLPMSPILANLALNIGFFRQSDIWGSVAYMDRMIPYIRGNGGFLVASHLLYPTVLRGALGFMGLIHQSALN